MTDDVDTLISGYRQSRVGVSGTTIVFYDVSDNKKYLTQDTDNLEIEGGYRIKKLKTSAADDLLKESFVKSTKDVEDIANIRFFDINNLSDEDRKYLKQQKVSIPTQPDIFVRYGNKKSMDLAKSGGFADYPEKNKIAFINISEGYCNSGAYFDEVVSHELGHTLGLKHPFESKKKLSKNLDNTDNTIMSYTEGADGSTRFQELDAKALRKIYKPSISGCNYEVEILNEEIIAEYPNYQEKYNKNDFELIPHENVLINYINFQTGIIESTNGNITNHDQFNKTEDTKNYDCTIPFADQIITSELSQNITISQDGNLSKSSVCNIYVKGEKIFNISDKNRPEVNLNISSTSRVDLNYRKSLDKINFNFEDDDYIEVDYSGGDRMNIKGNLGSNICIYLTPALAAEIKANPSVLMDHISVKGTKISNLQEYIVNEDSRSYEPIITTSSALEKMRNDVIKAEEDFEYRKEFDAAGVILNEVFDWYLDSDCEIRFNSTEERNKTIYKETNEILEKTGYKLRFH